MSYLSLYRKWRSQTFDEIVGQKHIVQTLKNAITKNKIAHAYLFCGPRGTGKTSVARIFAKSLNCEKGPTVTPCGECGNCIKTKNGHAVDVTEIDAASNRGIDEIRDLREKVRYAPVEGKYKVYIIDEVHMLTSEAFNALLKTLEEPPQYVIFILATTETAKIPPTIESRCQRLDFSRISLQEVKEHLKKIGEAEGFDVEEKALDIIARSGEGSMRDSVSLLDQAASYSSGKVTAVELLELIGVTDETVIIKIADSIIKGDLPQTLKVLGECLDRGQSSVQILREILTYFRNLLFVKFGAIEAVDLSKEQIVLLQEEAKLITESRIKEIISKLSKTELEMKWHPNAKLVLEIGIIDIFTITPIQNAGVLPPLRDEQQQKNQQITTPIVTKKIEPTNVTSYVPPPTANGVDSIKSLWPQILDKLKKKSLYGFVSLHEGEISGLSDDGKLVISYKKGYSFHKERLDDQKNKEIVESVIEEVLGKKIKIATTIESPSIPQKPQISVDVVKNLFEGELI